MNNNPTLLPLTNDEKIDAIHQEEFELLTDLLSIIDTGSDDEITLAFEKFIEHMQMHFDHEQELMKSRSYLMANIHEGEHYKVLNEARYNLMNWRNFKDKWELKEYFGEDFIAWLNQHIEAMDNPMVNFFKSEGGL